MLPTLICRSISGISVNQLLHYLHEINYGYFGKYMRGSEVPSDFDLSKINIPVSLHYSLDDIIVSPADEEKLIPKLQKNIVYIQAINQTFDHGKQQIWKENIHIL